MVEWYWLVMWWVVHKGVVVEIMKWWHNCDDGYESRRHRERCTMSQLASQPHVGISRQTNKGIEMECRHRNMNALCIPSCGALEVSLLSLVLLVLYVQNIKDGEELERAVMIEMGSYNRRWYSAQTACESLLSAVFLSSSAFYCTNLQIFLLFSLQNLILDPGDVLISLILHVFPLTQSSRLIFYPLDYYHLRPFPWLSSFASINTIPLSPFPYSTSLTLPPYNPLLHPTLPSDHTVSHLTCGWRCLQQDH